MITTDFERLSWYRLIFTVLVATYICLGREGNVIAHSLAKYAIDIPDFFGVDEGCSTIVLFCTSSWFRWLTLVKVLAFPSHKKTKKKKKKKKEDY